MPRTVQIVFIVSVLAFSCIGKTPEPVYPWLDKPSHFPTVIHPEDNQLTLDRWKLGRRLFFETKLSIDDNKSCASCHLPSTAFATNFPANHGANEAEGTRNSPSLANVAYHPYFTREGGVPTLEMQVLVPIQEENEFHNNILDIVDSLMLDQSYVNDALKAYNSEITPFVITRAISCFERTLISGFSSYDRYLSGDESALSSEELNGLQIFENKGCINCHSGHLLSGFEILNNGLYEEYEDPGLFNLTNDPNDIGKFKVPSLRNVSITHPYMYDGSLSTLDDVIDHYVSGGSNHPNKSELITPIEINEEERADLKAFLNALTDQEFLDWASAL